MGIHYGELGNLIEVENPDTLQKSRSGVAPIVYPEMSPCKVEEIYSALRSTRTLLQTHEEAHREKVMEVLHDMGVEDGKEESQRLSGWLGDMPG